MDRSPPVSVPRLRTQRLVLREYRLEDFDDFAAHLADPDSTAIGAADRRTAWRLFGCHAGGWLLQGAGWWSVELAETGQVVAGVGAFFREAAPEIEIGWHTYRAFRGKGIASEAAAEAVRYAFEVRGELSVNALITAGNEPSIRVAKRIGMKYAAETELFGEPIGRYTLERKV